LRVTRHTIVPELVAIRTDEPYLYQKNVCKSEKSSSVESDKMSNMEAALDSESGGKMNGDTPKSSTKLNPTPDSGTRYDKPIAAAQQDGLPIIDISSFLDPSSSKEARSTTAKAINAACVNYGFFYLTGHGIPTTKLDEIINLAREFFALPLQEKNKIKRFDAGSPEGGDGARGYQGLGENVTGGLQDMQEAIDWYRDWPADKREPGDGGPGSVKSLQGVNLWPEQPRDLEPVYTEYIERVKKVGEALVHAMGVALDLGPPVEGATPETQDEEVFVRNCNESFWVMRMIGYPPLTTPSTPSPTNSSSSSSDSLEQFSCGAHTDYGCVTLLLTDPTPGALQVLLKDGTTWLNADPLPGAFVVNIGDMIERWTNGLWKSTKHRVIHRGERYRVSVPFFYEPNFDAVVSPLAKCVERSGGRAVHRGGRYGEHLLGKVSGNFYYSMRTDW
jgi:isopenicillin N synthase-like dioxygenase